MPDDLNKMGAGPALGTLMEYTQIAMSPSDRFMRAVEKEMVKFERQEIEFRKKDRKERAAELQYPCMTAEGTYRASTL